MLKAVREMCDRIAWAWPEDYSGGDGGIVTVAGIEERCKAGHAIVLYIYEDGREHMAHVRTNHTMPIKPNSRIHTNLLVLPGAVPDNCIVLGMDNCPVDIIAKRTAAASRGRL